METKSSWKCCIVLSNLNCHLDNFSILSKFFGVSMKKCCLDYYNSIKVTTFRLVCLKFRISFHNFTELIMLFTFVHFNSTTLSKKIPDFTQFNVTNSANTYYPLEQYFIKYLHVKTAITWWATRVKSGE